MSRILVIDDSELVSTMLKEHLAQEGFEVALAADANQGYATALQFHPDLILLDIHLPDVAGLDLLRVMKSREILRSIPIIMITGTHHHTDHKVRALRAGADDFVVKPFEMPELIERIRAVLRRSAERPVASGFHDRPAASAGPSAAAVTVPLQPVLPPNGAGAPASPTASLQEALKLTLLAPTRLPARMAFPAVGLPYLVALLSFSLGGLALANSSNVKPALVLVGTVVFWLLCISLVVIACSILGIALKWKEGGRMMALAGLPLLLKSLGGAVFAGLTTLSPFWFTASPVLFAQSSSRLLERLDIFEIWMMVLVWMFVRRRPGSSVRKAWVVVLVCWPVIAYWQSLWKH